MNPLLRRMLPFCGLVLLPFWSAVHAQTAANPPIAAQSDAIVANYRKIIVLMDGSAALDPGVREHSATAGRILFQQNQELLSALDAQITPRSLLATPAPSPTF